MFLKVDPDMNIDSISKLILGDVDKLRKSDANNLDKAMNFVGKLPRFLLQIIFGINRIITKPNRINVIECTIGQNISSDSSLVNLSN